VLVNATSVIGIGIMALALLSHVPVLATASQVQLDCSTLAPWTKRPTPPQVNQIHVFCGEWKHNAPRGFHSRPGGLDPNTVVGFTITRPANAQGIYGGSWNYTGRPQPAKSSTMFPDTCSMSQVLNSIVYAAGNRTRCPANAPRWAVCGPNRPQSALHGSDAFCHSSNGTVFLIALARLRNGDVITAFPLQ
jgi:Bacterial EndoU nuclease